MSDGHHQDVEKTKQLTKTTETLVESRNPHAIEIDINHKTRTIWVNIDGICRLRAYRYGMLILNDTKEKDDGS